MSPQEILKVLCISPLFRGIPDKLIEQKLSGANTRTLNAGEILLFAGQTNSRIYIVLSGRLSIQSKKSGVEPIALVGEGECVGEVSILGDTSVSAYVVAVTECTLLVIEQSVLWDLIDSSHEAAHNMLRILASRIQLTDNILAENLERHHGYSAGSHVDELTGLYSRKWMFEKFERHLRRSILDQQPGCLMMLAMDHFKEYSDSYGQLGGDQALRDIAHSILSCLRPDDQAGHYHGKHFAVFMPNTTLANAGIAAERLREAVSQSMVVLPSGDALPSVNISIGVSQVRQDDTLTSLFARAEQAFQQAKANGGNCIKLAE